MMEVWLKQSGDELVRGTGVMEVKGDSSDFNDTHASGFLWKSTKEENVLRGSSC